MPRASTPPSKADPHLSDELLAAARSPARACSDGRTDARTGCDTLADSFQFGGLVQATHASLVLGLLRSGASQAPGQSWGSPRVQIPEAKRPSTGWLTHHPGAEPPRGPTSPDLRNRSSHARGPIKFKFFIQGSTCGTD